MEPTVACASSRIKSKPGYADNVASVAQACFGDWFGGEKSPLESHLTFSRACDSTGTVGVPRRAGNSLGDS